MTFKSWQTRLIISILGGALLGAIVAALGPSGVFWIGWLSAALLLSASIFILWSGCQAAGAGAAGGGRALAWIVVLAFVLRLGVGMALGLLLPVYGYDEPTQKSGYVFYDAHQRDMQAWSIVQTGVPIWDSFETDFYTDQYGGLLALSAAAYRYLSPDVHRPFLILILGAFASALGVIFLWRGLRYRWNAALAAMVCWIFALYPDGVLFGASQMREPFLAGLIGIALWGVLTYRENPRRSWVTLAISAGGMLLFSSRTAVVVIALLAIWFWSEHLAPRSQTMQRLGWVVLVLGVLGIGVFSWGWLISASAWDTIRTVADSGWVSKVIKEIGTQWRVPFITVYGLAQPVLPAALADPAPAIWKTIAILRAVGWYALAPLLLYSFFSVVKAKDENDRRLLVWTSILVVAWLLISSIRAGGDQWDNPRYRSVFLPWLAFLAAWGVYHAVQTRDWWLARWLAVEVIFLGYFTDWYFSRYLLLWKRLPFWQNVVMIVILSGIVLGSGWLWDFGKILWRRYRLSTAGEK